ncbi:MAG: ribokinase [Patescibacteria group bacterium]|nr:MAG: ribokinase [Patescibacteria group bacterium]
MAKKQVLSIGEVVLDETVVLKDSLVVGGKSDSQEVSYSVGGPSACASIFFAKMGYCSVFATSLAKDKEGYWIKENLERFKVKLVITYQSKTQKNIVLVQLQSGIRTIVKDSVKSKLVELTTDIYKQPQLIYLDRHQVGVFDQLLTYKNDEALIIFDPSVEVSLKNLLILKQLDYPIVPWEFVVCWSKDRLEVGSSKLRRFLKKDYIITVAEFGALLVKENSVKVFPAYDIKPVDVLGAGDIFRAAFGYALLERKTLDQAIDFANKVSALQCLKKGNSSAIPNKSEIEGFRANLKQLDLKTIFISLNQYNYEKQKT